MSTLYQQIDRISDSQKLPLEKIRDLTNLYFSTSGAASQKETAMIVLTIEHIATRGLITARDSTVQGQR